jgi:hypothetical protein
MIALALAVVLSQSDVYTWTDANGVVHYTDGASGVPDNAQKTDPEGSVTVLSREPKNLAEPLPDKPAPKPAAAAATPPPATQQPAAHAAVSPSPGGFTHTTEYPGLEGLDVYYRHDPYPYPYGYAPPQGWIPPPGWTPPPGWAPQPQMQPPQQKAKQEPELIVNTPAPKAPAPKGKSVKAGPANGR